MWEYYAVAALIIAALLIGASARQKEHSDGEDR